MKLKAYKFFDLDDYIYESISDLIKDICIKSDQEDKEAIFFEIFAEIVQNAAKANFKEVVRQEILKNGNNKIIYNDLMKNFKERLPKAHNELALKARKFNLFITLEVTISEAKILHLRCVNNRPASYEEMKRLDKKIEEAKKYKKLADYYLDHNDDTEGAGLGTALIDISLRAMGYNNFLYRVFNDNQNRTVAELIIDLCENTVKKV